MPTKKPASKGSQKTPSPAKPAVHEPVAAYAVAPPRWLQRITLNPQVLHGAPCIRGMRLPVYVVVGFVAAGMTPAEIIQEYPDLEPDDIRAALEYAAYLTREETLALDLAV